MIDQFFICDSCGNESLRVDEDEIPQGWVQIEDYESIQEFCNLTCAQAGMLKVARGRRKPRAGRRRRNVRAA